MVKYDFELKTGEKKYLQFIIRDEDKYRLNITGCTVTFQVQRYDVEESTLRVDSTCQITNPTKGECRYFYDDVLPVGRFEGELEAADGTGIVYKSYIPILIIVKSDLPKS